MPKPAQERIAIALEGIRDILLVPDDGRENTPIDRIAAALERIGVALDRPIPHSPPRQLPTPDEVWANHRRLQQSQARAEFDAEIAKLPPEIAASIRRIMED